MFQKTRVIRRVLTVCLAASVLLAIASPGFGQINDAEAKRVAAYPLTIDLFRRFAAVSIEMAQIPKTDPAFHAISGMSDLPLDEKIKRMEATPKAVAILKSHGISAQDLIMTSTAVTAVTVMKFSIQTGAGKNDANRLEWEASSSDHVKFYDTHKEEMKKFQDDLMQAALRR